MIGQSLRERSWLAGLALVLGTVGTLATAQTPPELARPIPYGTRFPTGSYANLNTEAGGPEMINLGQFLGERPIVLYYWIANNTRSEQVFQELQELVGEIDPEKLLLIGVAVPRPDMGVNVIKERIEALNIRMPVLSDVDFRMGKQLSVRAVPNISLIDGDGRLQLTNGGSLSQVLGYKLDLRKAIQRLAATGNIMTHGYLEPYYPVRELEGKISPDFRAPLLDTSVEQRWHSLLEDNKLNVLIFWSVDCPHCRKYLPEINEWLKQHPEGVNVVTCASVADSEAMAKTREFCSLNDFQFPTLVDGDASIGDLYGVTTTPTIVIMGPDGVVDSSIVSGNFDFGARIEKKKRELLSGGG